MDLRTLLTERERNIFCDLVNLNADNRDHRISCYPEDLDYCLRFWNENKQTLFKVFQNKLILEKEVVYESSDEQLEEEIYQALLKVNHVFIEDFYHWTRTLDATVRYDMWNLVRSSTLAENHYKCDEFSYEKIKIQKGARPMRILAKLNEKYIHSPHFEKFRLAHSMVLNQKKLKGKLCLSIHPLDYATMSDNTYEWDSCMSWSQEGGYRAGTIEMMNSTCVIVAYLKGDEEYEGWNSKKWRELFIVNEDIISAVKQYPYENDFFETTCLNWLRDLTKEVALGEYYDEIIHVDGRNETLLPNDKKLTIYIKHYSMYDDYYGTHISYVSSKLTSETLAIQYSGPWVCLMCGSEYNHDYDDDLVCSDCLSYRWCECCEQWVPESEYIDNHSMCQYCYDNLPCCEICENRTEDAYYIHIGLNDKLFYPYKTITFCEECFEDYDDIIHKYDNFGHWIHIDDIPDSWWANFIEAKEDIAEKLNSMLLESQK